MDDKSLTITAIEFFSGIGGLHLSLKKALETSFFVSLKQICLLNSTSGTTNLINNKSQKPYNIRINVIKAFEINEHANAVYKKNFPNTVISRKNIESLNENDVPFSNVWLLSPPCQPFTKGGSKKDSTDQRCKPFLNLINIMFKMDTKNLPKAWFVENVVDFEISNTHKLMMDMFTKLNYTTFEFLLSPTLLGIPNTRVRYYCISIKNNENPIFSLEKLKSSIYSKYNNFIAENILLNKIKDLNRKINVEYSNIICNLPYDSNQYIDLTNKIPSCIGDIICNFNDNTIKILKELAVKIVDSNPSFKFDIVNPHSKASTTFTKSYIETLGRGGPLLESSNDIETSLDKVKIYNIYIHIFNTSNLHPERFKNIRDSNNLRCFHPTEILSIMGFPKNWFDETKITLKQQYSLVGNSISIFVVTVLLHFLLKILILVEFKELELNKFIQNF